MAANIGETFFASLPLTSCCAGLFLTGQDWYWSVARGLGTPALKRKKNEAVAGGRREGDQRNASGSEVLAIINCPSLPRDKENSSDGTCGKRVGIGYCQVSSILPSNQV